MPLPNLNGQPKNYKQKMLNRKQKQKVENYKQKI